MWPKHPHTVGRHSQNKGLGGRRVGGVAQSPPVRTAWLSLWDGMTGSELAVAAAQAICRLSLVGGGEARAAKS